MEAREANNARMSVLEGALLEQYQRGLAVVERPFAAVAERLGSTEAKVIAALDNLKQAGIISRVGPVFRPHRIGRSTLAAMAVPAARIDEVAAVVSSFTEVNHNYEREHVFNLWFVATAMDETHLASVLQAIETCTGIPVISLPMLESYHIDLGFSLYQGQGSTPRDPRVVQGAGPVPCPTSIRDPRDQRLISMIQTGLPLVPRPYATVAQLADLPESQVLRRIGEWVVDGTIGRLGIVVRHRELGYRANGMVVWDVPDHLVSVLGARLSRYDCVTLCYRRRRSPPHWNYNLFCMIHGRSRAAVEAHVQTLAEECGLRNLPCALLFSTRRFKQRGAHYVTQAPTSREAIASGG